MNADFSTAKHRRVRYVQYIYWTRSYEYSVQVADTKDNYHFMSLSAYQPKVDRGCLEGVLLCMCESVRN